MKLLRLSAKCRFVSSHSYSRFRGVLAQICEFVPISSQHFPRAIRLHVAHFVTFLNCATSDEMEYLRKHLNLLISWM